MKFNQIVCAVAIATFLSSSVYAAEGKASGYRATKLIGSDIYNKEGEKIGEVDDFIIGSDDNVSFAVISVGGFLGIGDRLVAVPANLFTSNEKGQVVFPNGNKDDLVALPEFKYAQ